MEILVNRVMDSRLAQPFTCIISGPTGSGKSVFTLKLIEHAQEIISPPTERILFCYGEYKQIFDNYLEVEFHDGLPEVSSFYGKKRTLLVMDDLMTSTDDRVVDIFTKISLHRKLSVVYLTQNLFYKNKQTRTFSFNSHYIVLFKKARDATQMANLARQMYSGKSAFMIEAFKNATSAPNGYLLIDLTPETDDKLRLKTDIFPGNVHYVYLRK